MPKLVLFLLNISVRHNLNISAKRNVSKFSSSKTRDFGFFTVKPIFTILTFVGPCIVIYFYSETNQIHQFLKFILFCSSNLHVSDGLSVHHQESKTVHTASGICQTDSVDRLLVGKRWNW